MNRQLDLLIRAEGGRDGVRHQLCDPTQRVDVRDLTTRVIVRIRAEDLSPYRHALIMNGTTYQILGVSRVG